MAKKTVTQPIVTNKDLAIDYSEWKKNIASKRESYFDFNKSIIEDIAKLTDVKDDGTLRDKIYTVVQALFPQYLICSGLFDNFLLFDVVNGVRIDPPKYFYYDLQAYLNNDKNAKVNSLRYEIKDLFIKNNIEYSEIWKKCFEYAEVEQ